MEPQHQAWEGGGEAATETTPSALPLAVPSVLRVVAARRAFSVHLFAGGSGLDETRLLAPGKAKAWGGARQVVGMPPENATENENRDQHQHQQQEREPKGDDSFFPLVRRAAKFGWM